MNSQFTYKVTTDDLRNVSKAYRIMGKGREASIRRVSMVMGIFFACVPIWNHSFVAIFPFIGGCLMIYLGLLKPLKTRRKIVNSFLLDEEIEISLQPKKISIQKTSSQKNQPTNEINFLFPSVSGLLLGFYDGSVAWLPSRVFASQEEMSSCESGLMDKIEESED